MWTNWASWIASGSVICIAPLLVLIMSWRRSSAKTNTYQRPASTLPVLENTIDFVRTSQTIHDWLAQLMEAHGQTSVLLKAWGQPDILMVSQPSLIEDVLKTQFECFEKGWFNNYILYDLIGHGIFAVDGVQWSRQRKTASHLFTMRTLRDHMAATVQKQAGTLLQIFDNAAKKQESIDLFKLFNRFTIETFSEIGFGIQMGCLNTDDDHPFQKAFDSAQRIVALRFLVPMWLWRFQRFFGIGMEGQLKKDIKVINDTVYAIISESLERRARNEPAGANGKDIVSLFLDNVSSNKHESQGTSEKVDSEVDEFDPTFLRDIVISFLIAGRDTTAQALSWFFWNVSQRPEIAQRIRQEIREKLPELHNGQISFASMEQVSQLTYLEATIKETLRLHPSVPLNSREAIHDTILCDGTFIPTGMNIGLSSYGLGRMEHVWGPDAKLFNPDRWIDPSTGKITPVSAFKFNSFHAGPRMCLGMNLAMLEMKILISGVLSRFDLVVDNPENVTYDLSLTLPVKGALWSHVRPVQAE